MRRACTTAAVACVAFVATAPACSHALVAPRHSMMSRARAAFGTAGIAEAGAAARAWVPTTRRTTRRRTTRRRTTRRTTTRTLFDDEDEEGAVSDARLLKEDSLKAQAKKAWAATPP